MDSLKAAFEDVADWCERHLEGERGLEIGMNFGALLRTYGRLATLPAQLHGESRGNKKRELNAKAEALLMELCTRFLVAIGWFEKRQKPLEPISMPTNMTHDPGPPPPE
jgi:hypothetical protein